MRREEELRPATRAALEAVRAVRALVQQRVGAAEVTEKAPNDIVTATDVLVQQRLAAVLGERQPDIVFVGEEATDAAEQRAPDADGVPQRMWLVDPICGTGNYAAALPLFATNVALVEAGRVVASCVADGGTGEVYVAERGRGAWRAEADGLRAIGVDGTYRVVSVDPSILGSGGRTEFTTTFALRAIELRRWEVRVFGSTIALAYVASGRLAAAVFAPLGAALHVAAGALLAQEAGAIVTDHAGREWTIDSPVLVVAATGELHAELQTLAAQVYAEVSA